MPDLDFDSLRTHLEESAVQPPFATIVARRQRRTQRVALIAAVVATVAVLVGGFLSRVPHRSGPVPMQTPSPSPTLSQSSVPPFVEAAAGTGTGTLYAIAQTCTAACTSGSPTYRYTLVRSADLGASWTRVGLLDGIDVQGGAPGLIAADDTHLWIVTGAAILSTVDGGRHWTRTPFPGDLSAAGTRDSVAGGTAWLVVAGRVVRAPAGQTPTPTAGQPPGGDPVAGVTAFSADAAVALRGDGRWYATTDAGAHWTATADPCTGTTSSAFSMMAVGPDGTRWVVCTGQPGAGQQPKALVVSTDGGRTWQPKGTLAGNGYGDTVYPMSATVAWRTGPRSDIYRTTDRTQWTDVAPTGGPGGPNGFVAIDPETAVYFDYTEGDLVVERLTRDGGQTWTTVPFNPPL